MSEADQDQGALSTTRITRRELLQTLGGAAAGLVLTSCSPAPAPGASPAANAPASTQAPAAGAPPKATAASSAPASAIKRGGTIRMGVAWTLPTLDPHLTSSFPPPVYMLLYNNLMRYELVDPQKGVFEAKPELAESWSRPDPSKFVLKLRQGVKFHDGSDFDAEVAKWNVQRWITNPKFQGNSYTGPIAGADALDKYTLQINLKSPQAAMEAILSGASVPCFSMISKAAFEKLGETEFGNKPVGTGPMKFVEWKRDDRVVLERFDGYWEKGADGKALPYFDRYVERFIQDPTVTLAEIRSNNIDVTEEVEAKDVAAIKSNPQLVYYETPWGGFIYFSLGFSFRGGKFFDNLKLRQAALHALDRESMAKTFGFGIGRPHYFPYFTPGTLGYDDANLKYEFQPDKAKQLVKDAGFPNGVEVTLSVITRQPEMRIGEMVKAMWDEVGIKTTLESMERLAWIDKITSGKFDASFWRQPAQPDSELSSRGLVTGASSNWPGASIPSLDKAMTDARVETDPRKRQELYKQAQQAMYESAFWGSGYFMPGNKVYRKEVKGLKVNFDKINLREAWLDS